MRDLLKAKRLIWGVLFVLASAVACLSYFSGTRYVAAVNAVEHALAVQAAIDGTLSSFKDAESGQRGFILTGDPHFLEPYDIARQEIPEHIADLHRLAVGDDAQRERLQKLENLARQKASFIDRTVRLRRNGDADAASALVMTGEGKRVMDAMRAVCREMGEHEQGILNARRARAESARVAAAWGVGTGAVLSVLLVLLAGLSVDRDMKRLRRTAAELARSEEHFRLLTENASDLVRLLDLSGKVSYVSPSVERLLGFTTEEYLALPAMALIHPEEIPAATKLLTDVRSGAVNGGVATYRLRNKSGTYRYFEVRWSALRNAAGEAINIHTVGRDVTERKQAEDMLNAQAEDLRSLSLRDELTGLYNRRGFLEVAGQAQAQAARDQRAAAVIFVDLNGMKRINDQLGHDVGDDALRDASGVLSAAFTRADVVARLGGDEFVVFSLDFTVFDLEPLRQKLRALADEQIARHARPYRLSMSVGGAFSDSSAPESLAHLLERADAAMYEQKRARQAAGNVSLRPPSPSS